MRINRPEQFRAQGFSEKLKRNATSAEKILLKHLRKENIKFQFQKYFFTMNKEKKCFIVDFYIQYYGHKLAIEVDGGYHLSAKQKSYDTYREDWLRKKRKCEFMRFTNEEVFNNVDCVIKKILDKRLSFIPSSPNR